MRGKDMDIILWIGYWLVFAVGAVVIVLFVAFVGGAKLDDWREKRAKRADSQRQAEEAKAAQITAARAARIVRLALPADDEFYVSLEYSLLQEATRLAATLCEGRSDPVDGQGE